MTINERNTKIFSRGIEYSEDDLVDYKIVAQLLGMSPRTVQSLTSSRALPLYKFGSRTIRYRIGDIIEWRDNQRYQA